jgi:Secretion system C-terminal sorting domain
MKKIILLSFTFLGICNGFAQIPSVNEAPPIQKTVSDSIPRERATVKLFPNPAKNKIELEVKGFEAGMVQLQIINVSGKLVRNDSRLLFSGNENIVVMFSLTPGIYFITLKQKDKLVKKKMVVQ